MTKVWKKVRPYVLGGLFWLSVIFAAGLIERWL